MCASVHAYVKGAVRGWACESRAAVCVLTFRLYNPPRRRDRTTRGIKDVDCYRRSGASTYNPTLVNPARRCIPNPARVRESPVHGISGWIEPGDKRGCQFEFEIIIINPAGARLGGARRVVLVRRFRRPRVNVRFNVPRLIFIVSTSFTPF